MVKEHRETLDTLLNNSPTDPDSGPATLREISDCEARMPKPMSVTDLVAAVKRIHRDGEVSLPGNGRWEAEFMRTYRKKLQTVAAEHRELSAPSNKNDSETAQLNGVEVELDVGTTRPATITRIAKSRFCIARIDLGNNHTARVHIPWSSVGGIRVKETDSVMVRITRLPSKSSGEPSYGGELVSQ